MEEILKNLNNILDQNNLGRFLEVLDEIYVQPKYEYIEVYYGSWQGWFTTKHGLIINGSYSGNRECRNLLDGLNQLGDEGWNLIICKPLLKNIPQIDRIPVHKISKIKPDYTYRKIEEIKIEEAESISIRHYYQYYYEYIYTLSRKKTPLFDSLLNHTSEDLYRVNKNPVHSKSKEEEALEEYEKDTFFKENIKLSSRAYVCLRNINKASYEELKELSYGSSQEIIKIPNIDQDTANEIIQFIKNEFGFEYDYEDGYEEE